MKFLVALLFTLGCPWSPPLAVCCPLGWTSYGGHCYEVSENGLNFEVARITCRQKGGDLVNMREQDALRLVSENGNTILQTIETGNILQQSHWMCKKLDDGGGHICEEGWHYDRTGGNCYMVNENVLSWEVARTHCMAFKGDLASITGPDDKAFIRAACLERKALLSAEHYIVDWAFYATSNVEGGEASRCRLDSTYQSNTDRVGKVENLLSENGILARVIRIHTKEQHEAASMRVELIGCWHG
ncbi:hypothetical protein CAPTEDRAFT_217808 [Capitella teleta]|uniref:C-type lectin domain-containing protein n=1 Tax=Capitella teleta TaxID=283909 RepID=R7TMA5_CAPTE|nr:hypothetical protein CAPTEDRAFT_217808 [Capitella teleta]|eukprot:ELT94973.1 hypothetical protein CAPTEDRAFT_217808 [Capitella teleta]